MATVAEITQKSAELPPIDPSVAIPRKVREAAEKANAFYGKPQDAAPAPAPVTPAPVAATSAPAPVTPAPAPATPAPAPAPLEVAPQPPAAPQAPQAPQPATPVPAPQEVSPEQWEHRYNSMKGRYDQASHTIGQQGEQLRQMGDELTRMHELLRNLAPQPQPQPAPKLVTDSDVQTYGPELVDLIHRASTEAVAPKLSALEQENNKLKQRLNQSSRQGVYAALAAQLPEWQSINTNPRFKQWLSLRDIYSGEVRQTMLNRAMQAADAPRVLAFFKGFVADEQATGQQSTVTPQQQQQPAPARQAAVALETLAAPGRANPATGDTQVPAEKPVFTRQQVAKFYDDVRKGAYVGREQQKEIEEQAFIAASREGRVR